MSGYSREQVGVVVSESGTLVVVCPGSLKGAGEVGRLRNGAVDAAKVEGWCKQLDSRFQPMGNGNALAFAVPIHDGEYPVYATYGKDGDLETIEIDLRGA